MCHGPPVFIEDITHICVCGKQFEREEVYNHHRREIHNEGGVPSYTCEMCDFSTESKERLDTHIDSVHRTEELEVRPSYTCGKCGFSTRKGRTE